MNAVRHARGSVKKWGGVVEDYLPIHTKMDSSKISHATIKHRIIFHSAFGIFLIEELFGPYIINSDGIQVPVREIAEAHVMEDLGRIPSLDEWLKEMPVKEWMGGTRTIKREKLNLRYKNGF